MHDKKQVYLSVSIILFFVITLAYRFYNSNYEDKRLKKTKNTTAILVSIRSGKGVRATPSGKYRYSVSGKEYKYDESRNFNSLKVGDTILIKYSVEDPSVARVVEKYYMKKYRDR